MFDNSLVLVLTADIDQPFTASGTGCWGLQRGTRGRFNRIELRALFCDGADDEAIIEVRFHHNLHPELGLPYTDHGCMQYARAAIRQVPAMRNLGLYDIDGSEQGMQGNSYLSCDASATHNTYNDLVAAGAVLES